MIKIKKSLKPILPTLKSKKRYLIFEIISKHEIGDYKSVSRQILAKIQEFLGILGISRAGVQILPKYNKEKKRGMIKVNHKHVDELKAALAFVDKLNNKPVIIKTVGVSGIIKKAETRYM